VRLPLAGPYRPRARLFQLPDGRLLWQVRLWQVDRAVTRTVSTDVLRAFAQINRFRLLEVEIDALVEHALEATRDRP
jgi:hypothetical protein